MELALQLVEDFLEKSGRLQKLINKLVLPYSTTYVKRIESREAYMRFLHRMIGMGIMLSSRNSDVYLLSVFKSFSHRFMEASAFRALAIGSKTLELLSPYEEQLQRLGSGSAELLQLEQLMQAYQQALNEAENKAADRRGINEEIKQLIIACNTMLKLELDILIRHHQHSYPEIYQAYQHIRKPKRKHSKAAKHEEADGALQKQLQQPKPTNNTGESGSSSLTQLISPEVINIISENAIPANEIVQPQAVPSIAEEHTVKPDHAELEALFRHLIPGDWNEGLLN
ncbi:MAG: hypothetical protein KJ578_12670 [Bacteroidetes bacterium]|nr:hypothetical protein [Bacteroidota bacterium]MBU2465725.1 hypothetical protein [Bacteroidota bacterium]MBU2558623.1 hypothetical protein [Bacteroidota bacterium]